MGAAILEAIRKRDWAKLGVLLGVVDKDLGLIVRMWSKWLPEFRSALGKPGASGIHADKADRIVEIRKES